jgi:Protein of unknown function (DUF2550)
VGGALALDAAWLFAAFLVILVLAAAGIAGRRFLLERGGGSVECGLRKENGSWRLGVALYRGEELCWYGIFGLSVRPDEVLPRRDLEVVSRRLPTEAEAASLGPGMIVVECRLGEDISQFGTVASGSGGDGAGRDGAGRDGAGREGSGGRGTAAGDGPGGSAAAAPGSGAAPGAEAGPAPGNVVTVELALGESALTGLLSWLEAAPPGSHLDVSR